jgi:hypothetical protein
MLSILAIKMEKRFLCELSLCWSADLLGTVYNSNLYAVLFEICETYEFDNKIKEVKL